MKKLYAGSISADHKYYYIIDSNCELTDSLYDWSLTNLRIGYISNDRALTISTVSDYCAHWIEVFFSEISPILDDCERALVFNINVPSGKLRIDSAYWYAEVFIDLLPGCYTVYILAYNLGKQPDPDLEDLLEDDELEQRLDLERYKIVLVPGKTNNEGVIKGSKYLPDCVFDEE
jgi:hypothetical protein